MLAKKDYLRKKVGMQRQSRKQKSVIQLRILLWLLLNDSCSE